MWACKYTLPRNGMLKKPTKLTTFSNTTAALRILNLWITKKLK